MEIKKSKTANLEHKRFRFFQVGLILSVSLSLAAFEWLTPEIVKKKSVSGEILSDEVIFVPKMPEPEPEKQEKQAPRRIIDLNNTEFIETEKEIIEDPNIQPIDNPLVDPIGPIEGEGDGPVTVTEGTTEIMDWTLVDEMPSFDYMAFLQKHLSYPRISVESGKQGTVYVRFVVTKDGQLKDAVVSHTTGNVDDLMKKEALRIVTKMPEWVPGKMFGLPVSVSMILPIKFVLH